MYVDENVLSFMGSREYEASLMSNETVEASVAFIDICSFTSISENEQPDTVVTLLNKYFDVMVKEIIAQNGIIDKFILKTNQNPCIFFKVELIKQLLRYWPHFLFFLWVPPKTSPLVPFSLVVRFLHHGTIRTREKCVLFKLTSMDFLL